jgi:hypothetical protein
MAEQSEIAPLSNRLECPPPPPQGVYEPCQRGLQMQLRSVGFGRWHRHRDCEAGERAPEGEPRSRVLSCAVGESTRPDSTRAGLMGWRSGVHERVEGLQRLVVARTRTRRALHAHSVAVSSSAGERCTRAAIRPAALSCAPCGTVHAHSQAPPHCKQMGLPGASAQINFALPPS